VAVPNAAASSSDIVAKISGTTWKIVPNGEWVYTFNADGTWRETLNGELQSAGRWQQITPERFRMITGATHQFSVSPDGRNIIRGDGQTWQRGRPIAPVAPKAAATAQALRTEFETLNKTGANLFVEAMRSYNRQDTGNLETLKKRVGASDIDLLQKIQDALTAVANNESFEVDGIPGKKLTPNERTLISIQNTRERNLASAQRSVSSRGKSAYDALLKRAIAAGEFELAKEIQAKAAVFTQSSSPIGNWRECQGDRRRVILKGGGAVWHEAGGMGGTWKQVSTGVFTITKGYGAGWEGSTWKYSPDGKTLKRIGADWKLVRE
jgi:hypothetical protein